MFETVGRRSQATFSVDSWVQLGDRATVRGDVGVGRKMVGFACGFTTLELLGGEKVGLYLPQVHVPS